jgi:hypothetical protein
LNSDPTVIQLIARRNTDFAIPAPNVFLFFCFLEYQTMDKDQKRLNTQDYESLHESTINRTTLHLMKIHLPVLEMEAVWYSFI